MCMLLMINVESDAIIVVITCMPIVCISIGDNLLLHVQK